MLSSLDPSTGRFKAHVVKDFLITSVGSSAQESKIHCKMALLGGVFKLTEAVSSFIPTVLSQWSYFSVQEDLMACSSLHPGPGCTLCILLTQSRDQFSLTSMLQ